MSLLSTAIETGWLVTAFMREASSLAGTSS
jgi:hypothetical protein